MIYSPIPIFKCSHFNTIYRKTFTNPQISYIRKRLLSPDNDFIDLDFSKVNSKKLFVIIHGLEGSSKSKYVLSNTIYFNNLGYDVCAVNLRGCSGEPNKLYISYHSGKTDDLDFVISEIEKEYNEIILLGYSLGGNLMTKYVGETGMSINSKIKSAISISVPADLTSSAIELNKPKNYIYQKLFMNDLKSKLKHKIQQFPECNISLNQIENIKTFKQFDGIYTSIAHGFKDAEDYWKQNSSKQFIYGIKIPFLMINALDDPFLGEDCYPSSEAKNNPFFTLETPKYGGHVGFNISFNTKKNNWLEKRIFNFIN